MNAYEEAEKIAQEFITANLWNEFWKDEVPTLWEWTPMYMEKNVPSYIEYAVICNTDKECGFILINLDWDDVKVPTLSLSDTSTSTILAEKSKTKKENLEFYYFSPFDIYARHKVTGEMYALDPQVDPTEDSFENIEQEERIRFITEKRKEIPELFEKALHTIQNYKQSDIFQKKLKEKGKKSTNYIPSPSTWKYVPGGTTSGCNSRVPCYHQIIYAYVKHNTGVWLPQVQTCATGCIPVAVAMMLWYHDRNGKPNLIKWAIAPVRNTTVTSNSDRVRHMIAEVRGYMGTYCTDSGSGSTKPKAIPAALLYIKLQWYTNSQYGIIQNTVEDTYTNVKTQVDNGNPVLIGIRNVSWWHAIVWYWYSTDTTSNKRIIINAGWWSGNQPNKIINLSSIVLSENGTESTYSLDGGYYFTIQ